MLSPASLKDRVPPHNDDAEVACLGAVLLDPGALERVIPYLRPDDFYKGAHGRIFRAILGLSDRNEAIDLITLTEQLRTDSGLDAVGGPGYISSLTSSVPTSANVEYYARIVREMSMRRRLLKMAAEITASGFDDGEKRFKMFQVHRSGHFSRGIGGYHAAFRRFVPSRRG